MALTSAEVLHIARLANLELTPDEVTRMTSELGAILQHVEQLQELDTRDVPPTTHVALPRLRLRADTPAPSLTQAEALAGAPRVSAGAFAVPQFVEE